MTDWSAAAPAMQAAAVPLIGMLVAALVVMAAAFWVRVLTGNHQDDD
ncbi:hypothetical protein ACFP81_14575 [Deinococcus lacus]|uniref:Uncharacterized protein n=1 Tax=Deinococcus lacus TaxID=392561 RepID=A0ABW1YHM8_9DEIO